MLKEILKNVTPQMLSNINEDKQSKKSPKVEQNPNPGAKTVVNTVKKAKPLLSEALAYSRSPDAKPMSPGRFRKHAA